MHTPKRSPAAGARYCEFIGDEKHDWDEAGYKKKCPHIGITDKCLLHNRPLGEFEGWRVCCAECTTPAYVKGSVSVRVATGADVALRDYMSGTGSGFKRRLFDLLFTADSYNRAKLAQVFPDEVEAVRAWSHDPDYPTFVRSLR